MAAVVVAAVVVVVVVAVVVVWWWQLHGLRAEPLVCFTLHPSMTCLLILLHFILADVVCLQPRLALVVLVLHHKLR